MTKYIFLLKLIVVAVCVIYIKYAISIFQRVPNTQEIRTTYSDLEKDLCLDEGIRRNITMGGSMRCPKNGIVTVVQGGRLGNQIWEYASVVAVAKVTGLQPYVPGCIKSTLEPLFQNLSVPLLDEIGHCTVQISKYIRYMEEYNPKRHNTIILKKYNVQPELIAKYIHDIIQELSIKKGLLEESQKILHPVTKYFNKTFDTFIGVHVRRTDYIPHIRQMYRVKPAYIDFYKSAIDYFSEKNPNSVFVVVTDDPIWCQKHFKTMSNVFVISKLLQNSTPELDMAILASCNHTIIDYGTFGEWGALLAGGETIFYKINGNYTSERLSKVMSKWHPLN